jgi:hypothetical protein
MLSRHRQSSHLLDGRWLSGAGSNLCRAAAALQSPQHPQHTTTDAPTWVSASMSILPFLAGSAAAAPLPLRFLPAPAAAFCSAAASAASWCRSSTVVICRAGRGAYVFVRLEQGLVAGS